MRRTRRDSKAVSSAQLSKLAWDAQRSGTKGEHALKVLQDALGETYPEELQDAIAKAKRRTRRGRAHVVVFAPTMERAIRRAKARGVMSQGTVDWYRKDLWPFSVVTDASARKHHRATAIVVWDPVAHFDTHHWVEKKREYATSRGAARDKSRSRQRIVMRRTRHGWSASLVSSTGRHINAINGGRSDSRSAVLQAAKREWPTALVPGDLANRRRVR